MSTTVTLHCIISGRVQGVWYRDWTVNAALMRDLTGWVCNRRDGSVEAVFHGPEKDVSQMIEACRSGPPQAQVESIKQTAIAPYTDCGFNKRPTQ